MHVRVAWRHTCSSCARAEGRVWARAGTRNRPVNLGKERVCLHLAPSARPAGQAFPGINREQSTNEPPCRGGEVGVELHLLDVVLVRVPAAVGPPAVEQLVDRDAEAPHVRRDAVVLSGPHFGSQVSGSSCIAFHDVVVLFLQLDGQSEVAVGREGSPRAGPRKTTETHTKTRR